MREFKKYLFCRKIIELGGSISIYDPKAMDNAKNKYFKHLSRVKYCENKLDVLECSDALILLTEWPEFRSPDFEKLGSI